MKITLFITVFLVISIYTFAQKPPKGTQKIVVNTSLAQEENLQKVSRTLQKHNLQVAFVNENYSYLSTIKRRLPNTGANFSLDFEITDSLIAISGKLMDAYMPNTLSKSIFWEIENRGSKGTAYKESFKIMYEIAHELGPISAFIPSQKKKENTKTPALASE